MSQDFLKIFGMFLGRFMLPGKNVKKFRYNKVEILIIENRNFLKYFDSSLRNYLVIFYFVEWDKDNIVFSLKFNTYNSSLTLEMLKYRISLYYEE